MGKILFNEQELLARLAYTQASPRTLVDVGAHIGNFCRPFGEAGWRVVAFEPDPDNYADLYRRVQTFADGRAIKKAVSDVTEKGSFYRSTEYWGIHSLKPSHPSHTDRIDVDLVRLDDALRAESIDRVTLLKIDAEGADFPALKSFPFDRMKPEAVMVEFMDSRSQPHFGYSHHDVVAFMAERDYVAYVSEWAPVVAHSKKGGGGGPFYFLQCCPYPLHHAPAWGNLIFIPAAYRQMFETTLNDVLVDLERRRQAQANSRRSTWSVPAAVARDPQSLLLRQLKTQAKRVPGARGLWRFGRQTLTSLQRRASDRRRAPANEEGQAPNHSSFETTASARVTITVADGGDAASLHACLQSLQRQGFEDWVGHIVVDHGLEPSLAVARKLAEQDPRLTLIKHGQGGWMTAGKNTGARLSDSPYVLLLGHEDRLLEGALGRAVTLLDAMADRPDVAGVRFGAQYANGAIARGVEVDVSIADFVGDIDVDTRTVVLRRDVFAQFGGFDESLGSVAEVDFWLRLLRHGYVLLPIDQTGVAFVRGALSVADDEAALAERKALWAWLDAGLSDAEVIEGTPHVFRRPRSHYLAGWADKRRRLIEAGRAERDVDLGGVGLRLLWRP